MKHIAAQTIVPYRSIKWSVKDIAADQDAMKELVRAELSRQIAIMLIDSNFVQYEFAKNKEGDLQITARVYASNYKKLTGMYQQLKAFVMQRNDRQILLDFLNPFK